MFMSCNFFIYLYKIITERISKLKNQKQVKLNTWIKLITEGFYYSSCINFFTSDKIVIIISEIEDESINYRFRNMILVHCNINDKKLYLTRIPLIYFIYILFYYILFFSYSDYNWSFRIKLNSDRIFQ